MNQDGVRQGYDVEQVAAVRVGCGVPLIASGGAGAREHFADVFNRARVDGRWPQPFQCPASGYSPTGCRL